MSILNYPDDYYTPSTLMLADVMTEKEMRREYTRLRKIANQRLKELRNSEFKNTNAYLNNRGRFNTAQKHLTATEVAHALSDVARFLKGKTSVEEMRESRERSLKTLREHGYSKITKSNINEFGEYMRNWRQEKLDAEYSSERAAELFELTESRNITVEEVESDFVYYLENLRKIQKMHIPKTGKGSDYIKKKIGEKR